MIQRTIITAAMLGLLTITAYSCWAGNKQTAAHPGDADSTVVETQEHHLSLLIAGDLMQHGPQIRAALQNDGTYNYDECFARIRPEVERVDVAIGNFEVTLGGKPYTGYPQFRAPDEYLQA